MLFFIAISTKMTNKTEKRVGEKGFGRIGKLLNENMFLPVRDLIMLQTYKKIPYRAIKSTIFFSVICILFFLITIVELFELPIKRYMANNQVNMTYKKAL